MGGKRRVADAGTGQVHAIKQGVVFVLRDHVFQDLADHPSIQRGHQAMSLRSRDEGHRQDGLAITAPHAQQHLHTGSG